MTLQSRIPISEHAAAQEPSKLGLDPGETISVEDAIKAVVTRSANDIAVAIAEAIGHDESTFAEMMTRKAHALGMSNTTYRNASGLPNDAADHHRARPDHSGALARGPLPALLPVFLDRRVRIRRRDDRQPQPSARPGRRRRRHQDRLHARLRLQPPDLGASRRPVAGRRGHGRPQRAGARPDHGKPDRRPSRARLDGPHRDRGRRRVGVRRSAGRTGRAGPCRVRSSSPPTCRRISPATRACPGGRRAKATTPTTTRGRRLRVSAVRPSPPDAFRVAPRPIPRQPAAGAPSRSATGRREPAGEEADAGGARLVEGPRRRRATPRQAQGRRQQAPAQDAAETTVAARSTDDSDDDDAPAAGKGWKIQIGATDDAAKATALLDKARLRDRSHARRRQADDREGAQGRRHALPRPVRRPRLGVRGIRLPLPQEERVLLLRHP